MFGNPAVGGGVSLDGANDPARGDVFVREAVHMFERGGKLRP